MLKKYENFVGKIKDATSKQILPWNKTSRENEYEAVIGTGRGIRFFLVVG